ncbi:hypothetical protein WMY93_021551 [Mugilogobius chulae]|uniref:TIR domain-containing protein n=1 Tax=Mugilogobius chulae TaxID=88201 RepID=A0AAW0NFC2_9GOBI
MSALRLLFALLLTLDFVFGAELDPNGLRLCVTSMSRIQNLSGQNRTAVPSDLPPDTEYLDISNNTIRALTDGAFSQLHRLCFLKMTNCGLTEISSRVFEKTPFLKILNVSLNQLSVVPDLSLPNIQILDLSYNFYTSYQLPKAYNNFKNLELFALGSGNVTSVHLSDFEPLQNVTLQHLILGTETKWLTYESGALAKLQLLQKISLKTTFCGNMDLLDLILADLNKTQVTAMRFVKVFPDVCNVSGNPFERIQNMTRIRNVTLENTWLNTSFAEIFFKDVLQGPVLALSFVNVTYNEDTPDGFRLLNLTHGSPIQFVSFDRIIHHQYRYPKFDLNFNLVLQLTYLTFSGTGMNILPCNLFSAIPNLERLDISDNRLDEDGFWRVPCSHKNASYPKLKQLSLMATAFKRFPQIRAPTVLSLYVDQNAITSIFAEDLAGFTSLQTLKAGSNPFACSCDAFWFVTSLNKSLVPDWPLSYTCSTPSFYAGKSLDSIQGLNALNCKTWLQAVLGLAVVLVVSIVSVFLFWKLDGAWYSKMLWVWIQSKRRGHKLSRNLQSASFSYHAFISYSHRDADWVESHLVTPLEAAEFTLCVHERDFVPGEWILDNIVKCVESSYKTIFVLSKHFVQSDWCNYELFFTQHRSISVQHDSMVFVLLKPISADSLPKRRLRAPGSARFNSFTSSHRRGNGTAGNVLLLKPFAKRLLHEDRQTDGHLDVLDVRISAH